HHFGWSDGRINPNQQTIARLNQVRSMFPPRSRLPNPYRLPFVQSLLAQALACITAARANILQALPFVGRRPGPQPPSPFADVFGRGARLRLLNRHFDLDKQADPGAELRRVAGIYDGM